MKRKKISFFFGERSFYYVVLVGLEFNKNKIYLVKNHLMTQLLFCLFSWFVPPIGF